MTEVVNIKDAILYLNNRFSYMADDPKSFFEKWRLGFNKSEKLVGDCEDYALTLLLIINGGSKFQAIKDLMSKRANLLVYEGERGDRHIELEYDGAHACNITKHWHRGKKLPLLGYKRVKTLGRLHILNKLFWSNFSKG